jgi:hypothetical protein
MDAAEEEGFDVLVTGDKTLSPGSSTSSGGGWQS